MRARPDHFNKPVIKYARADFPRLPRHFTVQQALDVIRREGVGERIIYFYVVDEAERLVGVLPTRRLLTSPLDRPLAEIMVSRVATLAQSLVLAFFLTLVLGLGESVSAQSMTVTVQALRATRPSPGWYARALRRELGTATLLGLACGLLVTGIVVVWRGPGLPALVIGGSIFLSLLTACLLGLSVPAVLHALKLDPKIAAGPVALALADIFTLLFYFNLGAWALGRG